jgi:phosphoglycolate phosphatase-like HAD superfamily hydrolase
MRLAPQLSKSSSSAFIVVPRTAQASSHRTKHSLVVLRAMVKTLVTFDVDGTLIRANGEDANKFHKDAFAHGFREVFGIETTIDVVQHHGSTDQLIVAAVMRYHGVAENIIREKMAATCDAMSAFALERKETAADGLELLPGVKALLERLSIMPDVGICLVTGNLEPIAWCKMEKLGIAGLFSTPRFGGFGSDHTERGELCCIARDRAEALLGFDSQKTRRFHFGDTPNDMKAAEYADATAIGLLTGIFSREQLADSSGTNNPIIFDDLSDTDSVLHSLGLLNSV